MHQPSSQLGRVLSWVSKDYVEGALPHGGAPRSSSLYAELHHSFLAPKNAVAAHRFLQIDRCPTTLHKAAINPKRSTAAQYVYTTKAK